MSLFKRLLFCVVFLSCKSFTSQAQIRLPSFFTDSMVLQRDQPIIIYGWAKGEKSITVQLSGKKATVKPLPSGEWKAMLPAMPAGGPYTLEVNGRNGVKLQGILLGDVWFCSGQSNMEWKLGWLEKEKAEMHTFHHPDIRVLTVPHRMSAAEEMGMKEAQWKTCTPQNAPGFSAVATYFARFLQAEKGVPIGLIVSAWGGTDIEAWIGAKPLAAFPKYTLSLQQLQGISDMDVFQLATANRQKEWEDSLAHLDPGFVQQWYQSATAAGPWRPMQLPGFWDTLGITGEGSGWFQRSFILPATGAKNGALLSLGKFGNRGDVFINGNRLAEPIAVNKISLYTVPSSFLKEGLNNITVRVVKLWGRGGFLGNPSDMFLSTPTGAISLAGEWGFRKGYVSRNPSQASSPNTYPSSLYNGMIHPFTNVPVKGILWYQGENNTNRSAEYETLLKTLISSWRREWKKDSLPFLVVQLPNYSHPNPDNQHFAIMRSAQQAATALPNVGLAVTLDIGDSTDIHPVNKKDVGYRLSLLARKLAYGETSLPAEGPQVQSVLVKEGAVEILFKNTGAGLKTPDVYGFVKGFELAGNDGKFSFMPALLNGNKVVIKTSGEPQPKYVRYAWQENPDANVYNSAGLPAAPFWFDVLKQAPVNLQTAAIK